MQLDSKNFGSFFMEEIEICKNFIDDYIVFRPYLCIKYKDLYYSYVLYTKKHQKQPVTRKRFFSLLKITILHYNINIQSSAIKRKNQGNVLIYQGLTLKTNNNFFTTKDFKSS